MATRVLVTGLGPVCSLGQDRRTFAENLFAGRSFVGPVARLASSPVTFGAEVRPFPPPGVLSPKEARYDRATQFAVVATHRALEDAGLLAVAPGSGPPVLPPRIATHEGRSGVALGTSRGAAELLEAAYRRFQERGADGVGPHASPYTTPGNLAGAVALHFGLRGPALTVSAACSSASQAIGTAFDLVRAGRADVMLAGGTEACLTPFCMAMFAATGILSGRADDPAGACRPFDRDRDGIVVGEGAGMIVLESEAHVRARGARAYCEVRGFGATTDAHSLTGVPPDGEGLARAISAALADGGMAPAEVAYINAHGTATRAGDAAEAAAIRAAMGGHGSRVAVSSTKSMTGHLIGASGGIEAAACALAIRGGIVPPTINLRCPDPACDLDHVAREARRMPVGAALSLSMGFGGNNAAVAFGEVG